MGKIEKFTSKDGSQALRETFANGTAIEEGTAYGTKYEKHYRADGTLGREVRHFAESGPLSAKREELFYDTDGKTLLNKNRLCGSGCTEAYCYNSHGDITEFKLLAPDGTDITPGRSTAPTTEPQVPLRRGQSLAKLARKLLPF